MPRIVAEQMRAAEIDQRGIRRLPAHTDDDPFAFCIGQARRSVESGTDVSSRHGRFIERDATAQLTAALIAIRTARCRRSSIGSSMLLCE